MKRNGICLALAFGLIPCLAPAQINNQNKIKEITMNNERNKEAIRQLFEEVINKGRTELLNGIVSTDYTGVRGEKGPAAFQAQLKGLLTAFPDIQYTLKDLVGGEDQVAVRWVWRGTHKAVFNGIPATGRTISNEGMAIFACKDGKITGGTIQTDRLDFLQQLGILPANPAAAASPDAPRFIDRFVIPAPARNEFYERMKINRAFIRTLPGFIKDAAYEYTDEHGNLICITIAEWENLEAMNKAKEAVQAEYRKEGFDPAEMMKRLNISMDRAIYHLVKD